jgi:multisubunit Na+/H+ antiporter MnhC subunit
MTGQVLVLTAIVSVFAIFAAVLAWAERTTTRR